jgi:hypothetical protein
MRSMGGAQPGAERLKNESVSAAHEHMQHVV